jgi:hypothetical protein
MSKDTVVQFHQPEPGQDLLSAMLREGAQQLIAGRCERSSRSF